MPDLYCIYCDGDGVIPIAYQNKTNMTLQRSVMSCSHCNPGSNSFNGRHENEEVDTAEKINELLREGYRFI